MKRTLSNVTAKCFLLLAVLSISMQSCETTNEQVAAETEESATVTRADLVVASPEHQALSREFQVQFTKMSAAFYRLSPAQHKEVRRLLRMNASSGDLNIMEQISSTLGYDMTRGFDEINNLFEKVQFPHLEKDEYAKALFRSRSHVARTRSSSSEEEDDEDDWQEELDAYRQECEAQLFDAYEKIDSEFWDGNMTLNERNAAREQAQRESLQKLSDFIISHTNGY